MAHTHICHSRPRKDGKLDVDQIKSAIKSVKKATKVASNAMMYHQAYVEKSAAEKNWDLKPYYDKISKNVDDSSDESEDEIPKNLKVSKETYLRLMKGIYIFWQNILRENYPK